MKRTSNFERRSRALLFFVLLALSGLGQAPADAEGRVEQAIRPLLDGIPQVAIVRLRSLLTESLPAEERREATEKLGEALLAAEKPEDALKVLSDPAIQDLPGTKFFRAQALAALSRWTEALSYYRQSAADTRSPFQMESLFGQAEALRALDMVDEAIAVLRVVQRDPRWLVRARLRGAELLLLKEDDAGATRVMQSIAPTLLGEKKERRLLRGRIEARRNRDNAIELYESILKSPQGTSHSVLIATLFALAEAQLQSRTPDAAEKYLEEFIERYPADPDLPAVFAKLDQLYAAERKQSPPDLEKWSRDTTQPRRALAQWYLARSHVRFDRRDDAQRAFTQMTTFPPALPALAEGLLEFAQMEMREGRPDHAVAILEQARALRPPPALLSRIEMLLGSNHHVAGRFQTAAKTFQHIAETGSPFANEALFNATLGWIEAGDATESSAASEELQKRGADAQSQGDLRLEQILMEAGRGQATAAESLRNFLRDFPGHSRTSEAYVALAELAFHAAPPRLEEARENLARAAENHPTRVAAERADYLTIWLEEAAPSPSETKVISLALEFLQEYGGSPFLQDVRLKLAETYYRRQDFVSAQTQFELLAQENANAPIAEKALFFAARSAAQTMGPQSLDRALILFDQVVKKNGEMKWAARNEQAAIERKLGKPQDAATLYDEVWKGDAPAAEKREALCARGDILYELGASDPKNYQGAIELYDLLAEQKETPPHWRNQALFKKGMCLEKLKAPDQALATFYRIIEDEARPGKPREFFWYYKAGFNAARLLEEDAKWQSAAAVYEKLAFAGGGRSEEAKARLQRIRLEHFLWDQ